MYILTKLIVFIYSSLHNSRKTYFQFLPGCLRAMGDDCVFSQGSKQVLVSIKNLKEKGKIFHIKWFNVYRYSDRSTHLDNKYINDYISEIGSHYNRSGKQRQFHQIIHAFYLNLGEPPIYRLNIS